MIAVSRCGETARIALLEGDVLQEFWLWRLDRPDGIGDLYTGRIDAVMPGLAGSFVELGGMQGFLPDSAGAKALPAGTYLAVRVTRAAQGGKGPRLERMPVPHGEKPGLLRRGPGPLRELCERHPEQEVAIDDYALVAELRAELGTRIGYAAKTFDAVLEDEIAGLAEASTPLPLGARMHITPAPAAVMIDIDAAAASHAAPLALNLAVIPEICRQIQLRNLSGGILIDFAGMKPGARAKLAEPLRQSLARDFLRPEFLGFSQLGFAEIVRRRVRPPLHEVLPP